MSIQKSKAKKAYEVAVKETRAELVKQIVEDIKKYDFDWVQSWVNFLNPFNPVSGTLYRGGNRLHLAYKARKNSWSDPRWMTFNHAKQHGWKVRKGEKSSLIEHWKIVGSVFAEDADTGETIVLKQGFPKLFGVFHVFNAEQIEGIKPFDPQDYLQHPFEEKHDIVTTVEENWLCPIVEGGDEANYIPSRDIIHLPDYIQFGNNDSFLRTMFHEMIHSTGHESRLNRSIRHAFGTEAYAKEELVAELGSMFCSACLELPVGNASEEHYQRHIAYLKSWQKKITDDPDYLFTAASAAQKGCDLIIETCFKNEQKTPILKSA